jgi:hypothetical protein
MSAGTSRLEASAFMFVLGLGLGMVMQVLVLAVQNAVGYEDLGVATSGATLFRSIGGSVGTAILGSIFANRLSAELTAHLPASARGIAGSGGSVTLNTAKLAKLPAPIHTIFLNAFTSALNLVFVVAAAVAAVAFVLTWFLEQRPLRDSIAAASTGIGESFAVPKHTDPLAEAARALAVIIGRDGRRQLVQRLAERAGVELSPAACWLIVRLHEEPNADISMLCRAFDLPDEVGQRALAELIDGELVIVTAEGVGMHGVAVEGAAVEGAAEGAALEGDAVDGDAVEGDAVEEYRVVTPAGQEAAEKLISERRASLERLCEGWAPEQHADLAGLLTRLAQELVREPSEHDVGARREVVGAARS